MWKVRQTLCKLISPLTLLPPERKNHLGWGEQVSFSSLNHSITMCNKKQRNEGLLRVQTGRRGGVCVCVFLNELQVSWMHAKVLERVEMCVCEGGAHFIIWFFHIFWLKYGLCEAEMFSDPCLGWSFFPFQVKLLFWSGACGSQMWLVLFKQHGRRVTGHTRSEGWWDVFTGSHNSCSLQSFPGSFDL